MNNVSGLNADTAADSQSTLCDSKSNSLRNVSSIAKQLSDSGNSNSGGGTLIYKTSRDIAREMETLKSALRDKENVIDR